MLVRAVAQEPSERERDGLMKKKIGVHRIERKTIPYHEIYATLDNFQVSGLRNFVDYTLPNVTFLYWVNPWKKRGVC